MPAQLLIFIFSTVFQLMPLLCPAQGNLNEQPIPFGSAVVDLIGRSNATLSREQRFSCDSIDLYGNEIKCPESSDDFFKNKKIVKLTYPNYAAVPEDLKPFLSEGFKKPSGPDFESVSFFAILSNDNRQLLGLATKENRAYGDDEGYTHGLEMGVSGLTQNKDKYSLAYQSNLYAHQLHGKAQVGERGEKTFQQQYLNQNVLKAVVDNFESGQAEIWSVGVGFVQTTSSNKMGILEASKQQQLFHNTIVDRLDPHLVPKYQNFTKKQKDEYSGFIEVFKGLQQSLQFGGNCYLTARGLAGLKISTIGKDSFARIGGSTTVGLKIPETDVQLKASLSGQSQWHREGVERSRTSSLELETGGGSRLGVSRTDTSGVMQRANSFDKPNVVTGKPDPIIRLFYSTQF
jgi:hypothetical protein